MSIYTPEHYTLISDSDYYPLPSENPELEAKALDLYLQVMRCRKSCNFGTAIIREALLGQCAAESTGTSRKQIANLQRRLNDDMDRRLEESEIDNTPINESLGMLERMI